MKGSASWNSPPTMETSSVPRPIQTPSNVQSSAPAVSLCQHSSGQGEEIKKAILVESRKASFLAGGCASKGTRRTQPFGQRPTVIVETYPRVSPNTYGRGKGWPCLAPFECCSAGVGRALLTRILLNALNRSWERECKKHAV